MMTGRPIAELIERASTLEDALQQAQEALQNSAECVAITESGE
jgi:predicted RNase H-like HicB family nuclease